MIHDENHPEMKLACEQLFARIKHFTGRRFTQTELDALQRTIKDHRSECKLHGVTFPELVAMILPEQGGIDLVRRDLEHAGIQAAVANLIQKYPQAKPQELVDAVRRAFPGYRPSMLQDVRRPRAPAHVS